MVNRRCWWWWWGQGFTIETHRLKNGRTIEKNCTQNSSSGGKDCTALYSNTKQSTKARFKQIDRQSFSLYQHCPLDSQQQPKNWPLDNLVIDANKRYFLVTNSTLYLSWNAMPLGHTKKVRTRKKQWSVSSSGLSLKKWRNWSSRKKPQKHLR